MNKLDKIAEIIRAKGVRLGNDPKWTYKNYMLEISIRTHFYILWKSVPPTRGLFLVEEEQFDEVFDELSSPLDKLAERLNNEKEQL